MDWQTTTSQSNSLYVTYTDPETSKPTMKFFKVIAPSDSLDTLGLKQIIFAKIRKHSLEYVLNKIAFLLLDNASVKIL